MVDIVVVVVVWTIGFVIHLQARRACSGGSIRTRASRAYQRAPLRLPVPADERAPHSGLWRRSGHREPHEPFGYLSKLCEDLQQATGGQFPTSIEDSCVAKFQVGSLSPPTPLGPRCLLDRPSSAPDGSPSCGPPLVLCRQPTRSCCFSFRTLCRQIS